MLPIHYTMEVGWMKLVEIPGRLASSRLACHNFGKIDNRHFVQQVDGLQELNPEDLKQSPKFIGRPPYVRLTGPNYPWNWPIFLWRQVTDERRLEAVELTQGGSRRVIGGEYSLWIR